MDDTKETAEQNRAVWAQEGEEQGHDEGQTEGAPVSRKRAFEVVQGNGGDDDEDDLEDEVKKRLAALRENS